MNNLILITLDIDNLCQASLVNNKALSVLSGRIVCIYSGIKRLCLPPQVSIQDDNYGKMIDKIIIIRKS